MLFRSKVNIKGAHSAALQEVTVTEFVGGPDGRAKDRSTKVKLHDPVKSMAELSKLDGAYPPSNVLKLEVEPGDKLANVLENLLRGLRGYTPPDEAINYGPGGKGANTCAPKPDEPIEPIE